MPESPTPASRSLSPWWALLLLPVGLGVGWGMGQLPSPPPKAQQAAVSQGDAAAPVSADAPRPASPSLPTGTLEVETRTSAPAPVAAPAPTPVASSTQATERSSWTTIDQAIAESQRNGKPVLIDFNADWCGPCRRMRQQLFDDSGYGDTVQRAVIPVSIVDRVRENGANSSEVERLQDQYDVRAFPTLIVFSPATGRSAKTQGFGDAERTLAWITEAANSVR